MHREKFKPLGGPDGGNGGRGGDVVVVAEVGTSSLLDVSHHPHRRAANGTPGQGGNKNGADAADVYVRVPIGTVVTDERGGVLADLTAAGDLFIAARGGRGGLGNAALASKRRKAPHFALLGEPGDAAEYVLELKTLADVGLVGFPSAGKSSLVSVLSAARPKVADYPFTTLIPHLGVVTAGGTTFTVADVPGLIPGASQGRGLGLEFLRHVERCEVLVHVVDCATLESGRDPISDIDALEAELAAYGILADRPRVVVLNKIDIPEARDLADMVQPELEGQGWPVFQISTASHEGLRPLTFALAGLVTQARAEAESLIAVRPRVVIAPTAVDDSGFNVKRLGSGAFRVTGARPTRWVRQTDFSNEDAVAYLAERLARLGVEEELRRLGAVAGSEVLIGPVDNAVVFDWQPSDVDEAELLDVAAPEPATVVEVTEAPTLSGNTE